MNYQKNNEFSFEIQAVCAVIPDVQGLFGEISKAYILK